MNKNTVIGIILLAIIFIVGITLNTLLFPADEQTATVQTETQNSGVDSEVSGEQSAIATGTVSNSELYDVVLVGERVEATTFSVETEKYIVEFSNQGGTVIGYELKDHTDDGEPVEMLLGTTPERGAFMVTFGDYRSTQAASHGFYHQVEGDTITFYQDYGVVQEDGSTEAFRLTKTYNLVDGEYLFRLDVDITNSSNSAPDLNFGGISYTLDTGFDIGPSMGDSQVSNRYADFRKFYSFDDGDRDEIKAKDGVETSSEYVSWNGVMGKYFTLIGIPGATQYTITYNKQDGKNQILYSRPVIRSSAQNDPFLFYLGPKEADALGMYSKAGDNALGLSGLELNKAMESSMLGWLQTLLRIILDFFYRIIPNYGIAIIFTTIIIKILLFPFTKKSYISMGRMRDLQPQIKEIQEKYKDNQQKAQQAQMELYKKEGVNPMGGCLPMLLQMPILIAFYGLLNTYFPLREAVFIPGWIGDLSMPEYILRIPALQGVAAIGMFEYIRLLPILYTASMFLSTKLTQTSSPGQSGNSAKMMQYGMPLIFFFIFYSMPSGLLLYWMFSNIVTIIQQMTIQRYVHNHPEVKTKKKKSFMQRLAEKSAAAQAQQQNRGGKIKNSTKNRSKRR